MATKPTISPPTYREMSTHQQLIFNSVLLKHGIQQMFAMSHRLSQHVSRNLIHGNLLQTYFLLVHSIMHPMAPYIKILSMTVICSSLAQLQSTLAITVNHIFILFQTQFLKKSFHPENFLAYFNQSNILCGECVKYTFFIL